MITQATSPHLYILLYRSASLVSSTQNESYYWHQGGPEGSFECPKSCSVCYKILIISEFNHTSSLIVKINFFNEITLIENCIFFKCFELVIFDSCLFLYCLLIFLLFPITTYICYLIVSMYFKII